MRRIPVILAVLVALFLLFRPFVTVGAGQRAVLFSLRGGTLSRQLGEGTHFIVPFVQKPIFYDVRTQTYTMSAISWEGETKGDDSLTALTADGQEVKIDVSVRYHPDANKIYQLHKSIGVDYANKIIRPAARSAARVVFAEYPVGDVFSTRRELITQRITENLRRSLGQNNIILDEVLLRDLRFSPAYAAAIQQKQIAQQNAQRMQYVLQRAQIEKQIQILIAQGEARSIQLRGRAIAQNARIVQYEYARKIAPNVGAIITDGRVALPFASGGASTPAGR
ncbi:MAG: prohibitin family protein [Armatimonadetes bacterium]|nr:prohibitin family protein [Armatimonadota bacterium]